MRATVEPRRDDVHLFGLDRCYQLAIHDPGPVLQRLCEMTRADRFTPRQIGDSERELQDAVVGACGKLHLAHGAFHQPATGFVQRAELPYLSHAHICVVGDHV